MNFENDTRTAMEPEFKRRFEAVCGALQQQEDATLVHLGKQMHLVLKNYCLYLTVVGVVGRRFAECLSGWILINISPGDFPMLEARHLGIDPVDFAPFLALGERRRLLGPLISAEASEHLATLTSLGNKVSGRSTQ
jgi:hypothetical protein